MAWMHAFQCNSVYITKYRSMKIPVSFCTCYAMADKRILVDSGAMDNFILISDVVHLFWTYLILLIRIRLYLCRLDYILSMFLLYLPFGMFLLSSFGTPYCSSLSVHSFVLRTIDGLDLASRTFHVVQ